MANYLYIFYSRQISIYLLYCSYKERKGEYKMKMNSIIRYEIKEMVDHARRCAKYEKNPKKMRHIIDSDFYYASGCISALMRADVISYREWLYDRRVLKYHCCRLLSTYGNEPYMYKDSDSEFYWNYIR